MKEVITMAKKSPSPAVVKAVQAVVATPVVAEPAKVRGPKQYTSEQYLTEYLAEQANGGTWESLCSRTGFGLANVRQCITNLRSEYRAAKLASATASPEFLAKLAKVKKDIEVWADEKAAEKFPFLNASGTRNTQKSKIRKSWEAEELSL